MYVLLRVMNDAGIPKLHNGFLELYAREAEARLYFNRCNSCVCKYNYKIAKLKNRGNDIGIVYYYVRLVAPFDSIVIAGRFRNNEPVTYAEPVWKQSGNS